MKRSLHVTLLLSGTVLMASCRQTPAPVPTETASLNKGEWGEEASASPSPSPSPSPTPRSGMGFWSGLLMGRALQSSPSSSAGFKDGNEGKDSSKNVSRGGFGRHGSAGS